MSHWLSRARLQRRSRAAVQRQAQGLRFQPRFHQRLPAAVLHQTRRLQLLPKASAASTAPNHFGGSGANGDSADVFGTATTPDGNLYYKVNVIVSGIGYPLYVPESSDLYPLTPDAFNATYGGGDASQSVTDSSDASDDGGNAGDDGGNGGGYDGGYDGYYDYGGGPDHAEP